MKEPIEFFYDPRCPWAWRTSKWVRELERDGIVSVDWRLFSLAVVNDGTEEGLDDVDDPGTAGLRTLAFVKAGFGNQKAGELYLAIGQRTHEVSRRLTTTVLQSAVGDAGLEATLIDHALAEAATKENVLRDHHAASQGVGAFGVPTIVLASGKGIFGPVVDDEGARDALELWTHVHWLIENAGFYELKRERD
jgi:predicted DsbA family dithiol-disulfide isomerase